MDEVEVEPPIQEVEVESPYPWSDSDDTEVQVESPYPWSDSDDTDDTLSPPTTPTYQQECAMTVNGVCKIEGCRQCGGTLRGFIRKRNLKCMACGWIYSSVIPTPLKCKAPAIFHVPYYVKM